MNNISLLNDSQWPNVYSCRFLEAGIVSYKDSKDGILRLTKETIDKMAASFIGKPVLINHKKVGPENYKSEAVGYVMNVKFNSTDAWFYCDFLITDEKARELIEKENYSVSCAYNVISGKEGGSYHDIPYDGEITDGSFTHLALVENPRYEDSKISKQLPEMLVNDKAAHFIQTKEDNTMKISEIKDFIFQKVNGKNIKVEPVVVLNGKEYQLADVLEAIQEKFNGQGEMEGVMASDDMVVDINGHSYKINDLKTSLKNWKPGVAHNGKDCDCTPKDGMHAENCPMYKENESEKEKMEKVEKENNRIMAKAKQNGKSIAEVVAEEAQERLNSRGSETEEMKNLRLENDRLKKKNDADALFNSLKALGEFVPEAHEEVGQAAPMSRQERANKKKTQIDKQFVQV